MPFRTDRLLKLRQAHNLSQTELSEALGLSKNQIFRYENDESIPKGDALIAMAEFFMTTTDYLLGLSHKRHPDSEPEADLYPLEAEVVALMRDRPAHVQRTVAEVVRAVVAGFDAGDDV